MTLSFTSLGLSEARVQQLEKLGFTEPTQIQTQAIPQMLAGRDVVGQSQTGTGKTAAFSLPILERVDIKNPAVQALILTPTRELAQQVSQAIRTFTSERRLGVLTVYGGQSIDRQIQSLRKGVQVVVGTPGRVIDLLNRGDLKLDQVNFLVLDEADEMLSMGFIDDVETILKQVPSERQTAFFSATMPPTIQKLIAKFLRSPIMLTVEQPKAAPSRINQVVYMVPRGWSKSRALLPILELEDPESALIFVRTRRTAAELTNQLQAAGHSVDEYHGDLNQQARERLLMRFRQHQVRWVVATDIAARGLDVDHLSHVINYDLPDSVESYIHRIGRTGRAGNGGTAISLIQPMDRRKLVLIERKVRQTLKIVPIPTRAEIEGRRLEKLQAQVREVLSGERMASFLPVVAQLGEEYDAHAIAAAALQIVYDQTRPSWLSNEAEMPLDDRQGSKPKLVKRPKPEVKSQDTEVRSPKPEGIRN
ncbi:DEAD/DEAH box helicase [Trichocoleus sp. FACHB-90]|uniref:DEAD/DEAH box helicase n=1 Tax=Cyanophyceae TaxID=3028117 RepID=UPI001688EDA8|nr:MULTISPECIES: DEAD/DEAH box helicase [unclassified Trichocoleus]MBD1836011.1 DEAD/DEAH box helicase [Cyanobacteria bacterium FACHB-472]MBD1928754.1 DEAD/DEAH box helicase [Trichocoleus sp. FACHB-90]MBD2003389.1 DEAD/DEAH box helicase [Trichocoleus sp. FACHB-40]